MLRTATFAALFLLFAFAFAAEAADASRATWLLRGAVLKSATEERGHYEIGFYPTIGREGLPVGYPLVQEILPAGRSTFRLRVPLRATRGYLFAEFVEAGSGRRRWIIPTSNPWTPSSHQPAELYLRVDMPATPPRPTLVTTHSTVSAAPSPAKPLPLGEALDSETIRGSVGTLFSPAGTLIPQEGVQVHVRGRHESTVTDSRGEFTLRLPKFRGQVPIELLKDGYHPVVLLAAAGDPRPVHVDLANRRAVDQLAQRLGVAQGASLGVVLGRAFAETGAPLPGLTAQLSRQSEGPIYFDESGQPNRDLRATTRDGRFLFLNVQAGSAYLEAEVNGEPVAPVRLSTVSGGELLQKDIVPVNAMLSGRIYQAVKKGGPAPLAGARVRLEGTSDWTTSDSLGAFRLGPFKASRGERISVMFSAASFQNHRYQLLPGEQEHRLYAFPARYLEHLAESRDVGVDPATGLVIGRVNGPSVRIDALSDEAGPNPAQDFYFDARGRMRPSPAMTDPRFGTFVLFNVPAGHAVLLGHDGDGKLRFGKDLFTGPSVVSVEVESDR